MPHEKAKLAVLTHTVHATGSDAVVDLRLWCPCGEVITRRGRFPRGFVMDYEGVQGGPSGALKRAIENTVAPMATEIPCQHPVRINGDECDRVVERTLDAIREAGWVEGCDPGIPQTEGTTMASDDKILDSTANAKAAALRTAGAQAVKIGTSGVRAAILATAPQHSVAVDAFLATEPGQAVVAEVMARVLAYAPLGPANMRRHIANELETRAFAGIMGMVADAITKPLLASVEQYAATLHAIDQAAELSTGVRVGAADKETPETQEEEAAAGSKKAAKAAAKP